MKSTLPEAVNLHRDGRIEEARRLYQKALRRNPADADALNYLGILEFQRGERKRGVELLNRSLALAPRNPHAWINFGNMMALERGAEEASVAYLRALAIDQRLPEAWYNLGICQRRLQQLDAASHSLRQAIEARPDYALAYEALGSLLYRSDRLAEAAELYTQWLAVDPHNPVARHMSAASAAGHGPARADDRYVSEHFDRFAASFDASLGALGYRAPQLVADALARHAGYQSANLDLLDAGCGTGLCGVLLRSSARRLTGVDLSEGMLAKARERQVYDELIAGELTSYLARCPATFDAVISADTLCYFGDLEPVVHAATAALKPGGLLIFTVEYCDTAQGPYVLRPSGRYAHAQPYLHTVLAGVALEELALEPVVLRMEGEVEVQGWVATAQRPA